MVSVNEAITETSRAASVIRRTPRMWAKRITLFVTEQIREEGGEKEEGYNSTDKAEGEKH